MGKEELKETKILVVYVGMAGVRSVDIEDIIRKIANRMTPETFQGETIFIPTQSHEIRVECINPKYVTDEKLIEEHTEKMKVLHEELEHQIKQIKDEKNV